MHQRGSSAHVNGGARMSDDPVNRTKDGAGSPAYLLRMADKFRQHAQRFSADPMAKHWERYADDLEALAARLGEQWQS
jgi:hypothetical protein